MTVYAPAEAVEGTVIDNVDEPEPPDSTITEEGAAVTLQADGADSVNETVPLNPLSDVTVTVETPEYPATTVKAEGEAETEKSGPEGTFTVTVVE